MLYWYKSRYSTSYALGQWVFYSTSTAKSVKDNTGGNLLILDISP